VTGDDLMSYEDISRLVNIPVATLYVWKARGKLPEPEVMFRQPLWLKSTIDAWAKKEGLV
jgi:predicted DNA-binding transcriptional regulator AlpA